MGWSDLVWRSLLAIPGDESELVWVGTTQGFYLGTSDKCEIVSEVEHRAITAFCPKSN
ncbi:hypothetical protein [Coleofasciculus sp. F4-SAH-05]|uniref:hypothetical protein n=1 Tax=Coleofasciculus sp. F4-SAH-05 TaxID=3069525 RepID=UPI0032FD5EC8